MANAVVNKQKFLIHSKVYSKDEIKKYRLNIPAGVAVTTDTFLAVRAMTNM